MRIYISISAAIVLALFAMWTNSDWKNQTIRLALLGVGLWGIFLAAKLWGWL